MLPPRVYEFDFVTLRVKDGDTFVCRCDLGFSTFANVTLRMKDVWAPELDQPGGPEAREYLIGLLAPSRKLRCRTEIVRSAEAWLVFRKTLDRYVATILDVATGANVNDEMNVWLAGRT